MKLFDKILGKFKKSTKKIKVKLITESYKPDGQEEFLKPDEKMIITVGNTEKKDQPAKPAARKSEVIKLQQPKSSTVKVTAPAKPIEKPKPEQIKPEKEPSLKVTVRKENDDSYTKEAVTVTEGKATRNGKFDIQRAKDGRFFFNLYASNHTVIAYSQIYSSTAAAMNGINSIIANAAKSPIEDTTLKKPVTQPCPKWEIYIDKAGEYRFRLYAPNGLQICHSAHGYSTKSGCKGGIESIARFASESAKIDKSYLK